jgi:hypothetical protein
MWNAALAPGRSDDDGWARRSRDLRLCATHLTTLLNAYGWWFVSQVAMWAGYAIIVLALLMLILTALGFRHLRRAPDTSQI